MTFKVMFRPICADVITFFRHGSEVFRECFSIKMEIFTKKLRNCINKLYLYKILDYLIIDERNSQVI